MASLPQAVIDAMAARAMRMHHMLWHTARNNWATMPDDVRQVFREHGWEPPRPALTATGKRQRNNGSGEDFLYMHRQMIAEVDGILAEVGDPDYPRVEGWPSVPEPGDSDYPVPPPFDGEAIHQAKTAASFQEMKGWQDDFTDPAKLRNLTLGQLGADIEFTIHNRMHLRWSHEVPESRPLGDDETEEFNVDPQWDDPGYNWLADTYSAHVNPVFWKLHGWVDARIDDWMAANDRTGPVPWSFDPPWSGPTAHEHHHSVPRLALRARPGNTEARVLDEHRSNLEATVDDLRRAGARMSTPLFPVLSD
ncbi:hypothetical protein ACSNOH_10415 [Streptomyces sp. URMC 127]|uniref:hypothetical protein n=1 Tax=Streptomyces sp. URMC 127 TaxID=3423402 RepID=UPI003F19B85F